MPNILIVDDDLGIRDSFTTILEKEGYSIAGAGTGLDAIRSVEKDSVDIVLLDLKLPDLDGMEVLRKIKKINPNIPIIIISGYGNMDTVIKAIKEGAYDFLPKPLEPECVKIDIARAMQVKGLMTEIKTLKEELKPSANIVGNNPKMQEIFKIIGRVANEKVTVLLDGESGTGKELIAHAIHENSSRNGQPFVAVDCSAIPQTLMEGELFGHEKGAFTGAVGRGIGRFGQADKGTIFLDEISNIDLDTQSKFLRVLQEGEFQMIGAAKPTKVDVRIIAASNKNLEDMVTKGEFRGDLYHRLNVINIKIPPLRERKDDIPVLVNHFLSKFHKQNDGVLKHISKEALNVLLQYNWPGNIRELENVITQAVVTGASDVIMPQDLNIKIQDASQKEEPADAMSSIKEEIGKGVALTDIVAELEKKYIKEALVKANNNYTLAAKLLGIDRKVLTYKMKKYEIV